MYLEEILEQVKKMSTFNKEYSKLSEEENVDVDINAKTFKELKDIVTENITDEKK